MPGAGYNAGGAGYGANPLPPAVTLASVYANGSGSASSTMTLDATRAGVVLNASSFTGAVLDVQVSSASKFSVSEAGNLRTAGTVRFDGLGATGLLKNTNGGVLSVALAGTDYQAPLVAGTNYATPAQLAALTLATLYPHGAGSADSTLTLDATRGGVVLTASGLTGVTPVTVNHTLAPTAGAEKSLTVSGNFAPASGTATYSPVSVSYTVNQTGGANGTVTGVLLNATETAVVGTHRLMDLQVAGSSKVTVTNAGRIGLSQANPECVIQAGSTLGGVTLLGSASAPSLISLQGGAGTYPGLVFGASSSARGRLTCDDSTGVQLSTNVGTLSLFAPSNSEINLTSTQAQIKPGGTLVFHATASGVFGTSTASGNLNIGSTSNASKGLIQFGPAAVGMVYDETNKRLGIGASTTPGTTLTLFAASGGTTWLQSQVSGTSAVGRHQINTTVGDFEMRANRSLATELGQANVFSVLTSTATTGPLAIGTSGTADVMLITNSVLALTIDNATSRVKIAAAGITANGSGAITAPGSIAPAAVAVQEWWTVKNASGATRYLQLWG